MTVENRDARLPVLPSRELVLFPHLTVSVTITTPAYVSAVEAAATSEEKKLLVVAQRDREATDLSPHALYPVGTVAVVKRLLRQEGELRLILQGVERARVPQLDQFTPYPAASYEPLPPPRDTGTEVEALRRLVIDDARKIQALTGDETTVDINALLSRFSDPSDQAYLLASMLNLNLSQEQRLLEATSNKDALELLHDLFSHEIQVLTLNRQIAEKTKAELSREQREYVLRRQLAAIQQELGEDAQRSTDTEQLRSRLREVRLPDRAQKEVERELSRLSSLTPNAPDYQPTRAYLELVAELPWTKAAPDQLDLGRARQILDADHFDLKDVKERILELLAVLKLNPTAKSPILCFVGPPGVGKTSLGESIARSLGRPFERMSLGGVHDEAELRGHRRTYVGAMPGRIIQAIRRAGVSNPVLMLDEVDKIGRDYRGDPSAALLEILDPAQNHAFEDHYLNLPFDLSKVFFIATANSLDTIPGPLLDRMEVLRLSGYTEEEKAQIARRYLLPRQLSQSGLDETRFQISDRAVLELIRHYTREAGVRQLERALGRLARKAALRFAEGRTEPIALEADALEDWLGPKRISEDEVRKEAGPGIATGLAWTETGGEILYIEAAQIKGQRDRLLLTGQLGSVMRESAQAALTYVLSQADWLGIAEETVNSGGVHLHIPAGAIPKDGPSAGVTMAVALASLLTGKPARLDMAMTGEITISGLILPVGGIKEKVLAARRAGINRVLLPKANEKDLIELPESVLNTTSFVLLSKIDEALRAAIPDLSPEPRIARSA